MIRRRDFITLVGGAAAWPLAARAQVSSKRALIAWLGAARREPAQNFIDNFLRGMQDLGYVEARNFDMVYRFTDGYQDRLPTLTEEVIQLKPDVILAPAVISAVAARKATSTIPIVCGALADAVHLGLIASEARPGGNVTEATAEIQTEQRHRYVIEAPAQLTREQWIAKYSPTPEVIPASLPTITQ